MTQMTDRTKVIAVALALVSAGAAAILFAGSASAASWHTYQGDIYAGHAYGLEVPAKSESIEFAFAGDASGLARLGVYDPSGAKVGFYTLSSELTAASIASPAAGRHVVYVYEIAGGALSVRVNSEAAPVLALQQMPLQREDVKIGTFESGALDRAVTATLKTAPVFVTLLYEGSAQDLDATVASAKGDVVTITDESATAFSPGVWTTLSGQRTMEPANLEGLAYTVTAHAQKFEGTMVLTTLSVDFRAPAGEPTPVKAPVATPWKSAPAGAFALGEGKAIAFNAKAGTLLVTDPKAVQDEGKDANESHEHESFYDTFSLYAPDDTLLGYFELNSYDDEHTLAIELPVDGEYVAYVHTATNEVLLAKLANSTASVQMRELALATETFEFEAEPSLFLDTKGQEFTLLRAPVAMKLAIDANESMGVLSWADVSNKAGWVASANSLVVGPEVDWFTWSGMNPENFRAGAHTFRADGLFEGSLTLTSVSYLRDGAVAAAAAPVVDEKADAPATPPEPPALPMGGVGVLDL